MNGQEQATLQNSKTVNPEAYEAYLKGRYFWNKRTGDGLKKAIEYFSHAIEMDPAYADAYSGLADAYALSGDWKYGVLSPQDSFPKAKSAAKKALALDDNLGEAHASLAFALDSSPEKIVDKKSSTIATLRSGGQQIDDLLNGFVGAVVGGFELAGWLVMGIGAVVKAAVGERAAEPFVEEQKEQGDLNPFGGETVGVAGAVTLRAARGP